MRFAHLDFSTLAPRARACRAEGALNHRLAPDVYVGFVPLTSSNSGFAINGAGRLEFNDRLRAVDALDETAAFLHLECERLGGFRAGELIRGRLAHRLNDQPANGTFLFYRIKRAMLRARLSIAHLIDPHPRTPEKWPRLVRSYLHFASFDAAKLQRLLDARRRRQNTSKSVRAL